MRRGAPGPKHEELKALLDTVAVLSGYSLVFRERFPDGSRPDVLRFDPLCGSIFIGEAKDTESSGCADTYRRLARSMGWFKVLTADGRRGSMFAVCFGDKDQVKGWIQTISHLAKGSGVQHFIVESNQVDDGAVIVWLRLCC